MAFRLTRSSAPGAAPATPAPPAGRATSVRVGEARVLFGLAWSPVADERALKADLDQARRAGYSYGAWVPGGGQLGLARALDDMPGKPYSAALLLADGLSSGELEVFIFRFGAIYGFVALAHARPVAGFDATLPTLDAALALLEEFRAIHAHQSVRVVSNFEDDALVSELVQPRLMVAHLHADAAVRRLVNRPLRRLVGGIALATFVLGGAVAGALWYQAEQERKREEAERAAREADPDYRYEQAIEQALATAGTPGNATLWRWREIAMALPITTHGWVLTRIECQRIGCKGTWRRYYGNFEDFDRRLPPGAQGLPALTLEGGLVAAVIQSEHPLGDAGTPAAPSPTASAPSASPVAAPTLVRDSLPALRPAIARWGSTLQDLGLLSETGESVAMTPATLFPGTTGTQDAGPIQRPVMKAAWSFSDSLWSLRDIEVPAFVVPEALTVELTDGAIKYTFTGGLYAKGKDY